MCLAVIKGIFVRSQSWWKMGLGLPSFLFWYFPLIVMFCEFVDHWEAAIKYLGVL